MTVDEVINMIVEDYMACPNIMEDGGKVYCHTWYRHDDCIRLMLLLNRITNDFKYSLPEIREEVKEAIHSMLTDPNTSEILRRLKD